MLVSVDGLSKRDLSRFSGRSIVYCIESPRSVFTCTCRTSFYFLVSYGVLKVSRCYGRAHFFLPDSSVALPTLPTSLGAMTWTLSP